MISGPNRDLIKKVADASGRPYSTVRWRIMVSKKPTEEKRLFLALKKERDSELAEFGKGLKSAG